MGLLSAHYFHHLFFFFFTITYFLPSLRICVLQLLHSLPTQVSDTLNISFSAVVKISSYRIHDSAGLPFNSASKLHANMLKKPIF